MSNRNRLAGIQVNSITTHNEMMYPASAVSVMIDSAIHYQQKRLMNIHKLVMQSEQEIREVLTQLTNVLILTSEIVTLNGVTEKTLAWLVTRNPNPYYHLIGSIDRLNELFELHEKENRAISSANDPMFIELRTGVHEFARLILAAQKGRYRGLEDLHEWVLSRSPRAQRLVKDIQHYINVGGGEEKPHLKALFQLAYSVWLQRGNDWSGIAKTLWADMNSRTELERSPEQRMVYAAWKDLDHIQRKDQLRYIMPKPDDFEGI